MEKSAYEEILAATYEAIDSDVARAGALATDLNIPRPPLVVASPETTTHVTLTFTQQVASENICVALVRRLKDPRKGKVHFIWKLLVSSSALFIFWYYVSFEIFKILNG